MKQWMCAGLCVLAMALGSCRGGSGKKQMDRHDTEKSDAATKEVPSDTKVEEKLPSKDSSNDAREAMAKGNPMVKMVTSMGDVVIELDVENAPISVANFLKYVDAGFYDGTIFHRVIPTFMIQGGGFTPDLQQKSTMAPIKNEATNGLSNRRGTIAMARTSVVDSATSQFFINVKDNTPLDHRGQTGQTYGYAVFGRVTEGMEIVDKIKSVSTHTVGRMGDVPVEPVLIESIARFNAE